MRRTEPATGARRGRSGTNDPGSPRPALAPLDSLAREIQRVLELVKPIMDRDEDEPTYNGYCGVASEAYLHLAGARRSGLRVMRAANGDGSSHWWLEGPRGVIDLMYSAADRKLLKVGDMEAYDYEHGRRAMFMNGYARPSLRAAAVIELVEARR
jgi:hypothetical protein